jgi:hypothetical protein
VCKFQGRGVELEKSRLAKQKVKSLGNRSVRWAISRENTSETDEFTNREDQDHPKICRSETDVDLGGGRSSTDEAEEYKVEDLGAEDEKVVKDRKGEQRIG